MPTLILARHGRTTANATGVLAGRSKGVHLDERGLEQARAAGERLAKLPLSLVVSSPLERCRETAREIVRLQDPKPGTKTERGLVECDYGSWTGRELKTLAKEKLWSTVQAHPSAAVDLVLMDIMMPEMDGFTAMREIRKRAEWKKLPIIALTAKAMKDDQEKCLAAGANDYIAKPLDVEKLLSLVRVWMPK